MIDYYGAQVDAVLDNYVAGTVGGVMTWATAAGAALVTIKAIKLAWAIARKQVPEASQTIVHQLFILALIVGIATIANVYRTVVIDVARDMSDGMVTIFIPAVPEAANAQTVWDALQAFDDKAVLLLLQTLKTADLSMKAIAALFGALLFSTGTGLFEVVALVAATMSRMCLAFCLCLGPAAIMCLVHEQSKQYFWQWLGLLVSSVILTWVVFFVLGVSLNITTTVVDMTLQDFDKINIVAVASTYLIITAALAVVLYQAPSWAAALSGGSPLQLGAQMVQQIVVAARVGRGGSAPTPSAGAPNTVHHGTGLATRAAAGAQHLYQRIAARGRNG
ncbi:type IV secretion system protein [Azohydromonas australica]|uniref:type IV secretion system protein n=1 Tax=Azohydromonas australica TaxID=364039 RepID=UPI000409DFA6|nr:type IV secretion system protein [Azohydromonas australica]